MGNYRPVPLRKNLLLPAVCLALCGCGSINYYYSWQTSSGNNIIVHNNSTSQYYSDERPRLNFVSYNYAYCEFIDESGEKRDELTSTVGLSIVDANGTSHYYTAYAGANLYYYSYTITVMQIGLDPQSFFTELLVVETIPGNSLFQNIPSGAGMFIPVIGEKRNSNTGNRFAFLADRMKEGA